jgi:GTP-binding protein
MIKFQQATFLTSALELEGLPSIKLSNGKFAPEIAFIGRSNVGKSSLINTLLHNRTIAKTSSTPGKTQRINFFLVDEEALLVDLPGYGYSKAPKASIEYWSHAIDTYLNQRQTLSLVILLIDIRREPCEEDLMVAKWAAMRGIPFLTIFTKSDKVKRPILPEFPGCAGTMAFSNRGFQDRKRLIDLINKVL